MPNTWPGQSSTAEGRNAKNLNDRRQGSDGRKDRGTQTIHERSEVT